MKKWTPMKSLVVVGAALGVVALIVHSKKRYHEHNTSGIMLDPQLDSATRRAVMAALAQETDIDLLCEFSDKLRAAGFDNSADAILTRAHEAHVVSGYYVGDDMPSSLPPPPPKEVPLPSKDGFPLPLPKVPAPGLGGLGGAGSPITGYASKKSYTPKQGHSGGTLDSNIVGVAQKMFASLGYDVEADGVVGPKTLNVVKEFQSMNALDPDGILGPETMQALKKSTGHA
jgi:peptidoglycan hydrolase-like protein with peptidoglycan-binding domain